MLTGEILRLSARRDPGKTAVICGEARLSYGALDADANRFANALAGLGIGKGDAVAVMSRNLPEVVTAHFGNARNGSLLVALVPAYGPNELFNILSHTGAELIVVEEACQDKAFEMRDRLDSLRHVVVIGTPADKDAVAFKDFITGQPETPPDVSLDEFEPFAMTFTGGTTGLPKGALVSHHARFVSAYTTAIEHELTEADIIGLVTPLYHAVGLVVWLQATVLVGATCVIAPGWDAGGFVEAVGRHHITTASVVPVQLREVLSEENFDADKLASLRKIGSAGATSPPDLKVRLAEKLPQVIFADHYGQSETGPICFLKHWHPEDRWGTVGRPALGVEMAIVDAGGNPVPTGEVGEIVTRGPFMMEGYYNDPEETAVYFRSGDEWGWTGDLATMDGDGFVTLVGRSKDMIVSGGVNIYPREVELVLEDHPAVDECTVFGIPDEKWGEALVAYVVAENRAAASEDELIGHCASQLARFKRPKLVRFVDSIPKTPSGKTLKTQIREDFLKEHGPGQTT